MDQQQILGMDIQDEEFQMIEQSHEQSPDDLFFDNVVMALQQIVVDEEFEALQDRYMKEHCLYFQPGEENKIQYMQIFNKYHVQIQQYLQNVFYLKELIIQSLSKKVEGFDMHHFLKLMETRTQRIDQQIMEMLMSLSDFQIFKQIILDYRATHQEQERLKVLTIKSSKIPENKKVKGGSQNIFNNQGLSLNLNGSSDPLMILKNSKPQKKIIQKKEKTEDEIFLPDLVLTIKPLKKK